MKKFLLILFASLAMNVQAQVNFEHNYPNSTINYAEFGMTRLDSSTYMYYLINYDSTKFRLYNLNHSLYLTVQIPVAYISYDYNIQHITKSLFDCDTSNIEYLLAYHSGTTYYVKIFRTDGTQLFFSDSAQVVNCFDCASVENYYIVNTPLGAKMFLQYPNGSTSVFGLCGTLPVENHEYGTMENGFKISNPYPNPTTNSTRINYQLPPNVNQGEIVFYNLQGREIKRFMVDRAFDHLLISAADIAAGTYIYQLQTNAQASASKKIVVIK
ncbi:MAG: T9SS type A sorting domain-containing protein [Bacteroidetes bacterium]|nr:T9SS type A sorting domain-containing protein [Bacteroidota bacterium]